MSEENTNRKAQPDPSPSLANFPFDKPDLTPATHGFVEFGNYKMRARLVRMKAKRLAIQGVSSADAAKVLGYSLVTMKEIYQDPEFRAEVEKGLGEALAEVDKSYVAEFKSLADQLESATRNLFPKLIKTLNDPKSKLTDFQRSKLILELMDRVQETAKHTISHREEISSDDQERAQKAAAEMDAGVMPISKRGA